MDKENISLIMDNQGEEVKTQRSQPIEDDPVAFYGQPDSIYVRVKWDDVVEGFSFSVRNELLMALPKMADNSVEVPRSIANLSAFVRGIVECSMAWPNKMYTIGIQAQNSDLIEATEGLSKEQKDLLHGEPQGRA